MLPLLRAGACIGVLALLRAEAGPFSEQEIGAGPTFCDQAVIAIENVRLFNETQEALERQTATAEVLGVISSSVADAAAGVRQDPRKLRAAVRMLRCSICCWSTRRPAAHDAHALHGRQAARNSAIETVAAIEASVQTVYPMPLAGTARPNWHSVQARWLRVLPMC